MPQPRTLGFSSTMRRMMSCIRSGSCRVFSMSGTVLMPAAWTSVRVFSMRVRFSIRKVPRSDFPQMNTQAQAMPKMMNDTMLMTMNSMIMMRQVSRLANERG